MTKQEPDLSWMFVDMDSFFASAEQHLRPELRGHPVGIIPVESRGTCLIAASADAKATGVKVGTRVPDAEKLCPGIRLVKARPAVYTKLHRQVAAEIDTCLPICKTYSIDEWSIRLTRWEHDEPTATKLGQQIQDRLRETFSLVLSCSVGIAPTRLLAKIACDLEKPRGLCVLHASAVPDRLGHLRLKDLTGIASGMVARLERNGVRSVRELWDLTEQESVRIWGSHMGARWWAGFHGRDEPEQKTSRRSMGHASVLEPRLRTVEGARQMLARLVSRVAMRLRMDGYVAQRLSIQVAGRPYTKYRDRGPRSSEGDARSHDFAAAIDVEPTNDTRALLAALRSIWSERPSGLSMPLRVGTTASGLVLKSTVAPSLFERAREEDGLSSTLDTINRKLGKNSVYFGSMHGCQQEMDEKIAFGRVPEEMLS